MRIAIIRVGSVGDGFAGAVKAGHDVVLLLIGPTPAAA
jgi:hypothetical protein